jgi:hypothetical protein
MQTVSQAKTGAIGKPERLLDRQLNRVKHHGRQAGVIRARSAEFFSLSGSAQDQSYQSLRSRGSSYRPREYPVDTAARSSVICASKKLLATMSALTALRASPPQAVIASSAAVSISSGAGVDSSGEPDIVGCSIFVLTESSSAGTFSTTRDVGTMPVESS